MAAFAGLDHRYACKTHLKFSMVLSVMSCRKRYIRTDVRGGRCPLPELRIYKLREVGDINRKDHPKSLEAYRSYSFQAFIATLSY
jgi:hypothetical protein